MTRGELTEYLLSRPSSAKLARWVYKELASDDIYLQVKALEAIAWDERIPWKHRWLWQELERTKGDSFGDWVVIAIAGAPIRKVSDFPRFISLYNDETAHPHTRGSAVFGLNSCVYQAELSEFDDGLKRLTDSNLEQIRTTCKQALCNESNAYARAGACWLAMTLGGFEEDLKRLSKDQTRIEVSGGGIVAEYAVG